MAAVKGTIVLGVVFMVGLMTISAFNVYRILDPIEEIRKNEDIQRGNMIHNLSVQLAESYETTNRYPAANESWFDILMNSNRISPLYPNDIRGEECDSLAYRVVDYCYKRDKIDPERVIVYTRLQSKKSHAACLSGAKAYAFWRPSDQAVVKQCLTDDPNP